MGCWWGEQGRVWRMKGKNIKESKEGIWTSDRKTRTEVWHNSMHWTPCPTKDPPRRVSSQKPSTNCTPSPPFLSQPASVPLSSQFVPTPSAATPSTISLDWVCVCNHLPNQSRNILTERNQICASISLLCRREWWKKYLPCRALKGLNSFLSYV